MARDYKQRGGGRKRRDGPPPWAWAAAGLAVGLFVALLVYLHGREPETTSPVSAVAPAERDTRDVRKRETREIPPPPKPRFDFYTILPEMEVMVPEQEITGRPREGVPQVEQPGIYILQAGSFRAFEQADRFRAELALLGLETSIQTVTINGRETWHRVRVGPFDDLARLNDVRSRLKQNGIDAILLKVEG